LLQIYDKPHNIIARNDNKYNETIFPLEEFVLITDIGDYLFKSCKNNDFFTEKLTD
jgi:hypothetical protein